jgi:hypothetical protein
MRAIGLDLAVQTAHKAVVLDERGHFCSNILTVHTQPSELDYPLALAREGAGSAEVQVVMEPTGMAWFPIAVYYARQGCRSISSTARKWRLCAVTISATPKVMESMHECWPGSRWSIPTSSTAWCWPRPPL